MISCPTCGGLVSSQATFCNLCASVVPTTIFPVQFTPPPNVCFYHPSLNATYVCNRCGHSICVSCVRPYGGLNLCPTCFTSLTGLPAHYLVAPIAVPVYARTRPAYSMTRSLPQRTTNTFGRYYR